ncbi:MAG: preprotein translocase subunit YajC [bacterium]|nr:preprotein translocase subunit YajC [bacterium]
MTVYRIFEKLLILLSFILPTLVSGSVLAQEGGKPTSAQGLGMFLPLILIFVIFYLLIVRPQQKQAKKRQEMIKNLQKGDEVVTVGGILGRVVGVADNILTVEIADNCKVKMDRSGIQSLKGEQTAIQKK